MRFFDRADADADMPCPALVILDINLPKKQGGEVLKHMRESRKCARGPCYRRFYVGLRARIASR